MMMLMMSECINNIIICVSDVHYTCIWTQTADICCIFIRELVFSLSLVTTDVLNCSLNPEVESISVIAVDWSALLSYDLYNSIGRYFYRQVLLDRLD